MNPASSPAGIFGRNFPVPFTLDLAQRTMDELRRISEYYESKLMTACNGDSSFSSSPSIDPPSGSPPSGPDTGVVCECAMANDVPPGAPPR